MTIIIPVLNEERLLSENAVYYRSLKNQADIIFVDGGSDDRTVELAREFGRVVSSAKGKGPQKNAGATAVDSPLLVFVNADALLSAEALGGIGRAFEQGADAGCLTMVIDDTGWMFRFYEWAVNARARRSGIIDADLGMFIRHDLFDRLGGFESLPYMEDITFSRKLKKMTRARVLPQRIHVSSRRWHERGFVRTFLDYSMAYVKLWTGKL